MDWPPTTLPTLPDFVAGERDGNAERLDALAEARGAGLVGLAEFELTLGAPGAAPDVVVVALLLSYRAEQAWDQLFSLVGRLGPDLAAHPFIRQQHAFALNRAGRGVEAERILLTLREEHGPSPETNGILGRIYKDWFQAARTDGDEQTAEHRLRQAIDTYVEGHDADPSNPYPGLNALAVMEFTYPRPARRDALLAEVTTASRRQLLGDDSGYWDYATEWEIAALTGDEATATAAMKRAMARLEEPWQAASTSYNVHMLRAAWLARGLVVPSWMDSLGAELDALTPSGGPPTPSAGPPTQGPPPAGGGSTPPSSGGPPAAPGGATGPGTGGAPSGTGGSMSPPSPSFISRLGGLVKGLIVKTAVTAAVVAGGTIVLIKFAPPSISEPVAKALPSVWGDKIPLLRPPAPTDDLPSEPDAPTGAPEAEADLPPEVVDKLGPLIAKLKDQEDQEEGGGTSGTGGQSGRGGGGVSGGGQRPGGPGDPEGTAGTGGQPGTGGGGVSGGGDGSGDDQGPGGDEDPGGDPDPGAEVKGPEQEIDDVFDDFFADNLPTGASGDDVEGTLGGAGDVFETPGGGELWCYRVPGLDDVIEVWFSRNKEGRLVVFRTGLGDCASVDPVRPATDPEPATAEPVILGTGAVQVTLRWDSPADLDLFVTDAAGYRFSYETPQPPGSTGELDVDANASCQNVRRSPVENVYWPDGEAPEGEYLVEVSLFNLCGGDAPQNFVVEVKIDGEVVERVPGVLAQQGEMQPVVRFRYPYEALPLEASGRFTDLRDGTVRDNNTGLIWLKNANCAGAMDWGKAMEWAESLASGDCGLSDDSRAGDWGLPETAHFCSRYAQGDEDYGWCLPEAASDSLIDSSLNAAPFVPNAAGADLWSEGDVFFGVQSAPYWTATLWRPPGEEDELYDAFKQFADLENASIETDNEYVAAYHAWPVRRSREQAPGAETEAPAEEAESGTEGRVQLLVDCNASSGVLHTFSGPGCHRVTKDGPSYALLDPGTTAVLFPTDNCSGPSRLLSSSFDFCNTRYPSRVDVETYELIAPEINDNVRSVSILEGSADPVPTEASAGEDDVVRFVGLGNGAVWDNYAGLMWLENPGCAEPMTWHDARDWAAALQSGECGLSDGSTAGEWRLPTRNEFCSGPTMPAGPLAFMCVDNVGFAGRWKEADPFVGLRSNEYWLNDAANDDEAYYLDDLDDDPSFPYTAKGEKGSVLVVRSLAVRE